MNLKRFIQILDNVRISGTDHIKCVSCQSAIALPDDRHTVDFECDGCGCSYQINHTYIGSGEYEISINFVG